MRSETRFAKRYEDALQASLNSKYETFIDFYTSLKSRWSSKIKNRLHHLILLSSFGLIADILLENQISPKYRYIERLQTIAELVISQQFLGFKKLSFWEISTVI